MRSAWEIKHYSKSDTIIFTHGYTRQISKGDLYLDLDHKYNKAKMKLNGCYYEITFSDPKDKASDVKRVTVRIASKNYTMREVRATARGATVTMTITKIHVGLRDSHFKRLIRSINNNQCSMRKITLLLAVAALVFVSCGKEDYEVSNAAEGIFSSSLQIEPSGGKVREMVYFRLRDNLAEGAYLQHATLEADNLRDTITLVGYVGNANAITTIDNQPFACFSQNNIVINGIGNLQIIDILGRIVARYTLRNTPTLIQNSSFPSPGVYILRLCGDTTKTQKVVVVR